MRFCGVFELKLFAEKRPRLIVLIFAIDIICSYLIFRK